MPQRRPAPIHGEEVKWLLKKHPQLRNVLRKLKLKLTVEGRILSTPKAPCAPKTWTGGKLPADPLIIRRRPRKSRKRR